MRIKGRAKAGILVAALTVSAGMLSTGAANAAVVWDQNCGSAIPMEDEAWIQASSPNAIYCYYNTGEGSSNVANVYSLYAGQYTAVFQTSIVGPIAVMPFSTYNPSSPIHTYNFELS